MMAAGAGGAPVVVNGYTYEQWHQAGMTDDNMLAQPGFAAFHQRIMASKAGAAGTGLPNMAAMGFIPGFNAGAVDVNAVSAF